MSGARLIAQQSLAGLWRDRSVGLVALLFAVMVAVSAWLGWSATQTANAIYTQAAAWLTAAGQPVPPNPVGEAAPLAALRNLPVYISFLGSFAAIVIGQAIVEADRRAGVLPLVASRPVTAAQAALGRILALCTATAALTALAALVAALALLTIPALSLGAADWLNLVLALALGWLYMTGFGLLALGTAARLPGPAAGLLAATVIWLTLTFVFPALTGNTNPTAAINPVSALASVPDTALFHWLSRLVGPISLSEAFGWLEARTMGYLPDGLAPRGPVPPLASLLAAFALTTGFAWYAGARIDPNTESPDA